MLQLSLGWFKSWLLQHWNSGQWRHRFAAYRAEVVYRVDFTLELPYRCFHVLKLLYISERVDVIAGESMAHFKFVQSRGRYSVKAAVCAHYGTLFRGIIISKLSFMAKWAQGPTCVAMIVHQRESNPLCPSGPFLRPCWSQSLWTQMLAAVRALDKVHASPRNDVLFVWNMIWVVRAYTLTIVCCIGVEIWIIFSNMITWNWFTHTLFSRRHGISPLQGAKIILWSTSKRNKQKKTSSIRTWRNHTGVVHEPRPETGFVHQLGRSKGKYLLDQDLNSRIVDKEK